MRLAGCQRINLRDSGSQDELVSDGWLGALWECHRGGT